MGIAEHENSEIFYKKMTNLLFIKYNTLCNLYDLLCKYFVSFLRSYVAMKIKTV